MIGGALIFLRPQFHLSPAQVGLLGASGFLGAMVGMLVFGDMSDRLGRRAIFVANLIFFVVFSIVSAFTQTLPELFIVRFLVGVGVGMDVPTSAAYLAEISPRRRRGVISGSLLNLTWVLGALTSTLVALRLIPLAGNDAWRWMFGMAAVPALLVLLGRRGLPESPRWLVGQGRIAEAKAALARFGIEATEAELAGTQARRGSYGELFGPAWGKRVWLVALVFFLNCVSGPLSTIAAPYVLRTVGALSLQASLEFSALVWVVGLGGIVCGSFLIDRIGRRRLLLLPVIPEAFAALFMAFAGPSNPPLLICGYFVFSFCSWLGPAVLTWVWSSELFPTHLRGRSQGFCNATCRLAIAINIFLIPVGVATLGFMTSIVILSIPLFALAALVGSMRLFDSQGKSLETLAATEVGGSVDAMSVGGG